MKGLYKAITLLSPLCSRAYSLHPTTMCIYLRTILVEVELNTRNSPCVASSIVYCRFLVLHQNPITCFST